MLLRSAVVGMSMLSLAVAGCSAMVPAPVTNAVTATVTQFATVTVPSATTAVSTTVSTTIDTVTSLITRTEAVTVTATPIMDIPGPATGPACPGAPTYVNEAPDGLVAAVKAAWADAVELAAADHVTLCLNDGKRSAAQQQQIYDDYLREYGEQTADELVLPPDKSSHVTGFALDVQPASAYQWLQATAGALGFCRIYDNEAWHFEYRAAYQVGGCPKRLPRPIG